jgi:DNA polymerase-3 subunit epsilon
MRQVVLDTETTGRDADQGDRVVEIGCHELIDRRPTGRSFQRYLNPDRDSHPKALEVHGLTSDFLADKPRIAEVVDDFLAFVAGAELIIHNAEFDVGFIDAELARCGTHYGRLSDHVATITDTLLMARKLYPGQQASLNALCRRFDIDISGRTLHGALLDAGLLLDVYLAMTSGQFDLGLEPVPAPVAVRRAALGDRGRRRVPVVLASDSERAAHVRRMAAIEKASGLKLWPPNDET